MKKVREDLFRLNYLEFYDGMLEGLKLNFCDENEINTNVFFNVLIGENGVGKSIILRTIIDIFLQLEALKRKDLKRRRLIPVNQYKLIYTFGNEKYTIIKRNSTIEVFINDLQIKNIDMLKLPEKVMACSFLINDKFIFRKNNNESIYRYLGIRVHNTMTNTSLVVKQIANNIINSIDKPEFNKGMKECFNFLNLYPECKLVYKIKKKELFFCGDITEKNLFDRFDELWSKRSTQAFGFNIVKELKKNIYELKEIVSLINNIAHKINNKGELIYTIDFNEKNIILDNNINLKLLSVLSKMDILSNPEVYIRKNDIYSLESGSSGEIHILFLMTNILSNIDKYSLILIDEPEISLHPNWQMKIINLLKTVLRNCDDNVHSIIATHSHFMVSDLDKKSSSVLVIEKKNQSIISKEIKEDTYGWSAENILYNVFNVPSTRNYYLADELDCILEEISMGKIEEITDKLDKLKCILPNLKDNDPLKEVIEKILEKVEHCE